jgi:hypothetical protein
MHESSCEVVVETNLLIACRIENSFTNMKLLEFSKQE